MLPGAQTKYLMASHSDLETHLTKTKGTPHFLPILFIHPFNALFLSGPLFHLRGKETNSKNSRHLKGPAFSRAVLCFWPERKRGCTENDAIRDAGISVVISLRRCRWMLGWTVPCKNAGKKKKELPSSKGSCEAQNKPIHCLKCKS